MRFSAAPRQCSTISGGRRRSFRGVDHHQRADLQLQVGASQAQHFRQVGVLKEQLAVSSSYSLSKVPPVMKMRMPSTAFV